jgi:hypothetical protein
MRITVLTLCVAMACAATISASPANTGAATTDFTVRMVRVIGDQINDANEADNVLNGILGSSQSIAEDVTAIRSEINMYPDADTFAAGDSWPNGVNNNSMDDFTVEATAEFFIPEGDWTIAFGRDDGGLLQFDNINFGVTDGENDTARVLTAGDGEIYYGGTGGHMWTSGQFTVPTGGITTLFRAVMFERGGDDSFEVAIRSGLHGNAVNSTDWILLSDGALGWAVTPEPATLSLLALGGLALVRRRVRT